MSITLINKNNAFNKCKWYHIGIERKELEKMKILEPIIINKTTFKNRIMFPPLTTGYEERDGSIGEQSFNFYRRLAKGGVGYIVLGDVAPINTVSPTPKFFKDEQIETFKNLADALHEYDCKLGLQLFHPEYDVKALAALFAQGKMQEARAKLHHDMQHYINEVSIEALDEIIALMVACAKRASQAGVDCLQVHGDRLVGSLCSKILNQRTDEYGGSFENRTKFALKLVKALKEAAPDLVIDYKLPVITPAGEGLRGKGGLELDEAVELAKLLETAGVDMIHVGQANHTGNMGDTIPAMGTQPYGFTVACAKKVKEAVNVPVSAVGRIVTPLSAEAILENGQADFVALGRSLLTDPDFVNKCQAGKANQVRTCMMCNKGCTDSIQNRAFLSCVLNAENGYEGKRVIVPAVTKKNIAVVGAGIAGLEAARVAAIKGHHVDIYEKDYKIGGQINIACVPPRKEEMMRAINYYLEVLPELDVNLLIGKIAAKEMLKDYDEVIIAIGASNNMVNLPGSNQAKVVSAWDVLARKTIVYDNVVVIGGGLVGAETAEYIANQGSQVTVIEMLESVAKEESNTVLPAMMDDFKAHDVQLLTKTKVTAITSKAVACVNVETNEEIDVPADFVVMALGAKANQIDVGGLTNVHYIGDCKEVGDINKAVKSAYDLANSL